MPYKGDRYGKANARNAAIGANNCTAIASSTIGISSSSRRRMIVPKTPQFSYHPPRGLSRLARKGGLMQRKVAGG